MYLRCNLDGSAMFPRCICDVSAMYPRCFRGVSAVFPRCIHDAYSMPHDAGLFSVFNLGLFWRKNRFLFWDILFWDFWRSIYISVMLVYIHLRATYLNDFTRSELREKKYETYTVFQVGKFHFLHKKWEIRWAKSGVGSKWMGGKHMLKWEVPPPPQWGIGVILHR